MNLILHPKGQAARPLIIVIILWLCFFLVGTPPITAQTGTGIIRVAPSGSDTASCGSTATPCQTIQQAVNLASSGDKIHLAGGTYTGTSGEVVRIESAKTLTFIGGYSTANWNTSDPGANPTLIDGQSARRVFFINGFTGATVVNIQGVTIQNGSKTGGGNDIAGAGLYCVNNATVSLTNVTVKNNIAQGSGGNINTAAGAGAAFFKCKVTLQQVTFDGNQARGGNASPRGAQALGGGLFITDNSTLTGTDITVTNNKAEAGDATGGSGESGGRADANGGGVAIGTNTTANFSNLVVTNNQAIAGDAATFGGFASAGGLFVEEGTTTVSGGVIKDNIATAGAGSNGSAATGGGAMVINGSLTLDRVTITANEAQGKGSTSNASGGGVYVASYARATTLNGTNLIIASNKANASSSGTGTGGGLGLDPPVQATVTLNHVTFDNNQLGTPAVNLGGSAINSFPGNSTLQVNYTIISNHSASAAVNMLGGNITLNHTLWHNNNSKNSGAGSFTDNNPHTGDPQFVSPGSPNFDYHLQSNSAAINQAVGSTTTNDIDNQVRPHDSIADIGADEYYPPLAESTKSVSPKVVRAEDGPNHVVTYTIRLKNTSSQIIAATLTDVLPTSAGSITVAFNSGPTCTSGSCSQAGGNVSWSGNVPAEGEVTIAYTLLVSFPTNFTDQASIANNATLNYSDGATPVNAVLSSALFINGQTSYLPIIVKLN